MLRPKLLSSSILLLCAFLMGCQGAFRLGRSASDATPPPPAADTVARSFLEAWEQGDYSAMYGLLAPTTQAAVAHDEFTATYSSAAEVMTLTRLDTSLRSVLEEEEGTGQADFNATFETLLAGSFQVTSTLPLHLEENRWGVLWSRACILPQLEGGNHLYLAPEVPPRGNIYDRSGRGLAVNGSRVVIGVVPEELQDADRALFVLSLMLEEPIATLRDKYADTSSHWFVPLGEISAEEGAQYYDTLAEFPGVVLREKAARVYREPNLAPHVVGYMGTIGPEEVEHWREKGYPRDAVVGKAGLEAWGEELLAGRRGGTLTVVSPEGRLIATLGQQRSQQSRSIYTTIDRALQQKAVELLEGKVGAIVALDPHTGQVLALASSPTFDPNVFVPAIASDDWQNLINSPGRPLLTRATQGLYPPASLFKIVMMSAALDTGVFTPSSTFNCDGIWRGLSAQWPMSCWVWPRGHGTLDLVNGLIHSCGPVFYQIGLTLYQKDADIVPDYARRFGLGQPTGLAELPEEAGLVPDQAWKRESLGESWTPGDSVNSAIGQGYVLVTPLQLAVLVSAVGNGGTIYRPQIIHKTGATQDSQEQVFAPEVRSTVQISPEHLQTVREALRGVTSDPGGTAYYAFRDFPVSVAGKTGTAEVPSGEPHALFGGYAPADDPSIAIVVIIENAGQGAAAATPIFRSLVETFLGPEATESLAGG